MRTLAEVVRLMREYASHGAKELAPLLDPETGAEGLIKTRTRTLVACGQSAGSVKDPEAAFVVNWVWTHPKPHWALGQLQAAYKAPGWAS